MPLGNHSSFDRPSITTPLWRYVDIPKFVEMISSGTLWLANAETLASDDPYEGVPGFLRFPHRAWRSISDVPPRFRERIIANKRRQSPDLSPEKAFEQWFMVEEQTCIMQMTGRRNYFVNCWHAAAHESVAMWKIYASPGAGVAIVSDGARIETAIQKEQRNVYLGKVRYTDLDVVEIGLPNAFDPYVMKRATYSYEHEARLVHWDTSSVHDALEHAEWNAATMRYDGLIDDPRPLRPGVAMDCAVNVLVKEVIVSPFAPPWYKGLVERFCQDRGLTFPVRVSTLLQDPVLIR